VTAVIGKLFNQILLGIPQLVIGNGGKIEFVL